MVKKRNIQPKDLGYLSDEELLSLRFCDLPIRLQGSEVNQRIKRLYVELREKGLRFKPHVWLSDEWFAPDGIPGIAVPFYLAHPRLMRLEGKQMLEVEGEKERECMKILRHEAGHAIDTAYRMHFRREWQRLFGSFAKKYPRVYKPQPNSRDFVLHLKNWYAQSHPAEDFAETFAVWLTPASKWQRSYAGWGALKKLQYVDRVMNQIGRNVPVVRNSREFDPISRSKKTLAKHYAQRRAYYGQSEVDFYTRDMRRLFSDDSRYVCNPSAASIMRKYRSELISHVSNWTGTYQYTVDQILFKMIERAKSLELRLMRSPNQTCKQLPHLVADITMNVISSERNRVVL